MMTAHGAGRETDVCIIVEGCYPYIPGGVSAWIDWLIRSQPEISFSVVALWPRPTTQQPRYALPPNVAQLHHLYLQDFGAEPVRAIATPPRVDELGQSLARLMSDGGTTALLAVIDELAKMRRHGSLPHFLILLWPGRSQGAPTKRRCLSARSCIFSGLGAR